MRASGLLLAVLAIAGCAKEKKEETRSSGSGSGSSSGSGSGSGTGTGTVVVSEECVKLGMGLLGAVARATRGMNGKHEDGVNAWREHRADCRGGAWYMAGAIMLRAGAPGPLTADDVSLESATVAVERGLAAAPADLELLAYAGYLHGIEDGPLPEDACERVTALPAPAGKAAVVREHEDRVTYVCGAVALEAKDWRVATEKYGAVVDPPYPDVGVRRAQALAGDGRAKEARAIAKDADAIVERHAQRLGVTDRDLETLRAQLAAAVR